MNNLKLEKIINKYLKSYLISDNSINGLQIKGKKKIKKIITCVTINYYIINKSLIYNPDAIISHHGLIWKKNNKITNLKKKIIKKILKNNINIYTWHLPLDIHPKIGNNIKLSEKLSIKKIYLPNIKNPTLIGIYKKNNFIKKIKKIFKKFIFIKNKKKIYKIAICTGKGEKYIEKCIKKYNIDTYITGEISEHFLYDIKEYNINIFIIGHDNSEIYGIKTLGKLIQKKFNIKSKFINTKYNNNIIKIY